MLLLKCKIQKMHYFFPNGVSIFLRAPEHHHRSTHTHLKIHNHPMFARGILHVRKYTLHVYMWSLILYVLLTNKGSHFYGQDENVCKYVVWLLRVICLVNRNITSSVRKEDIQHAAVKLMKRQKEIHGKDTCNHLLCCKTKPPLHKIRMLRSDGFFFRTE